MDPSQNVSDVRRLHGMVDQLGKFIPHLAEKTKPVRDLLCSKNEFPWVLTQQSAYEKSKQDQLQPQLSHIMTLPKRQYCLPMLHLTDSAQSYYKKRMESRNQ